MILDRVKAILENLGIEYCLIVGVAVELDAEIAHLPKDARDAWQKLRV